MKELGLAIEFIQLLSFTAAYNNPIFVKGFLGINFVLLYALRCHFDVNNDKHQMKILLPSRIWTSALLVSVYHKRNAQALVNSDMASDNTYICTQFRSAVFNQCSTEPWGSEERSQVFQELLSILICIILYLHYCLSSTSSCVRESKTCKTVEKLLKPVFEMSFSQTWRKIYWRYCKCTTFWYHSGRYIHEMELFWENEISFKIFFISFYSAIRSIYRYFVFWLY